MKKVLTIFLLSLAVFLSGNAPPSTLPALKEDLAVLAQRGFTYQYLSADLIELTNEWSGFKQVKSLKQPIEAEIRAWANQRGIPILEIDPAQVDTSRWTGWYTHWTQVPLSNRSSGPLVCGDLDGNGNPEVYGAFKNFSSNVETRAYEVDTAGTAQLVHNYFPLQGASRLVTDANSNGLWEVLFTLGGTAYVFEQPTAQELPVDSLFAHERQEGGHDPGFTGIYVGLLDGDNLTDFLYKGSEIDTTNPNFTVGKTYVAEFNDSANNFARVWSTTYEQETQSVIGGYAVGDFDRDGKMEFVATHLFTGEVFLVENTGDNTYAQTWQDSVPFVNVYYQCTGDVDQDGKPEFFVGATTGSGNWTTMFEADSNDHYSPRFVFHLLSGGTLDLPTYLTTDVDGDGELELIIMSGRDLYVFQSTIDDTYALWYLKREDRKDAVQFHDLNGDGRADFLISKFSVDGSGRAMFYADIYKATSLVSAREDGKQPSWAILLQVHPNPFNSSLTISYSIPRDQHVSIAVYNLLGQKVATFSSGYHNRGGHTAIWKAESSPSGIYFCRLESEDRVLVVKTLLIR